MASKTNWVLGLAYRGSNFSGWQRQPDQRTVQGELEAVLSQIADANITVHVAGRTDAGVHATGQIISFQSDAARSAKDWLRGGNGLTGDDIQIHWVERAETEFHPRYSALARTYTYLFYDQAPRGDVFFGDLTWCTDTLDADAMHRAAQDLLGEQDFSSFRAAGCQSTTPMRRLDRCVITRHGNLVSMEITANAFLLHMVRNIATALHSVGRGEPLDIRALMAARDRTLLGATAPAEGLYLSHVRYQENWPDCPTVPLLNAISPFIGADQTLD